jgi:hypothetical protein
VNLLSSERYLVTDEVSPFGGGLASSGPSGLDGYFGYPAFSPYQATTGLPSLPGIEAPAVMSASSSTRDEQNTVNPPATFTNDFGGIKRGSKAPHSVSADLGEYLKNISRISQGELTAIAA